MTDLERSLLALGRELDLPEPPDLAPRVLPRLERRRRLLSRRLALALALVAVAVGAAFAVPQARSELLRLFGIGAVRIEYVDRLPEVSPDSALELGERVSLDEARRAGGSDLAPPPALLGDPDAVYLDGGGVISYLWGSEDAVRALLMQFPAEVLVAKKLVPPETVLEFVDVDGSPGIWIAGDLHVFDWPRPRLAANTLLWQRGTLTLRLEGWLTRGQALAIAAGTS